MAKDSSFIIFSSPAYLSNYFSYAFSNKKPLKSATVYYLLLLYLTVLFRPLIPIMEDAWSHTFNMAEHLSTVHAHQSKNYLHAALANCAADLEGGKHQKSIQSESQITLHIYTPFFSITYYLNLIKKPIHHFSYILFHLPIFLCKPPPKA